MLFADWKVRIEKTCDQSREAQGEHNIFIFLLA